MNGILKDLMTERADQVDPPHLDLATITRDGDRRLRRRRTALVGGIAATAAAAALAAPLVTGLLPGPPPDSQTATAPFDARNPVYAIGDVIHVDGHELKAPARVRALVQSDSGIVFSDTSGRVWATTSTDRFYEVGRTDAKHPTLRADGSHVAWVDTALGKKPHFSVLDHSHDGMPIVSSPLANTTGMSVVWDGPDPAVIYALDGEQLYLRDPRGIVRWNFVTDEQVVLDASDNEGKIIDVQDGVILGEYEGDTTQVHRVGPAYGQGQEVPGWNALSLSPDGRYVLGESEPDTFAVHDAMTGKQIAGVPDGYAFFLGYGWVDGNTYGGAALRDVEDWEREPVHMVTCQVGGECQVVAEDIGTFDRDLVLPVGEGMDG